MHYKFLCVSYLRLLSIRFDLFLVAVPLKTIFVEKIESLDKNKCSEVLITIIKLLVCAKKCFE